MKEKRIAAQLANDKHVNEIVLVRHGQTTYNVANRAARLFRSHQDVAAAGRKPDHLVELTPEGDEQAKEAARKIAGLGHFDCFFDSGYERSIKTLDRILEQYRKTERPSVVRRTHIHLREREPGYTFNMTVTEANQYFPWYQEYLATVGLFYSVPLGGESIAQVCSRVHMFLKSLKDARAGRRVLIVTHGRVMLCFRFFLEKLSASAMENIIAEREVPNCQILQYVWNGSTHGYDKHQHTWNKEQACYLTESFEWDAEARSMRPLDKH